METWKGGEWWKVGGGGTAWDSMAYDPELNLLYVGTGNGSPWVRKLRSPGGGDNLYLSSIVALNPSNGELVWYYQTTPGDNWDFTATQHMILADLRIDGKQRQVIMQAPKNGFFYVLDRKTGELISAEKYVEVTWASHVDKSTGRPVENPGVGYEDGLALIKPTAFGGHNWHPMSFSPQTGLVYIPTHDILGAYRNEESFKYQPGAWNTGTDFNVFATLTKDAVGGALVAWDPVKQKEVWRHPYALPWNGGLLSTAGNLVFEGTSDGRFVAYRASDGVQLWEGHTGTGVIAAPVTYLLDGKQYVSVLAGWGGAFGLVSGSRHARLGRRRQGKAAHLRARHRREPADADGARPHHRARRGLRRRAHLPQVLRRLPRRRRGRDGRHEGPAQVLARDEGRVRRHRAARSAARRRHAAVLGVPERGGRREAPRLPRPPGRGDRSERGRGRD